MLRYVACEHQAHERTPVSAQFRNLTLNTHNILGPIDAEVWFHNWERGGTIMAEARHLEQWDQTLTLLWFEEEELPPLKPTPREHRPLREDEEELEGIS